MLFFVSTEFLCTENGKSIAKRVNSSNIPLSAQKFIESSPLKFLILPEESHIVSPIYGKRLTRSNTTSTAIFAKQNAKSIYIFSFEYNQISKFVVRKLKTSILLYPSHYFM